MELFNGKVHLVRAVAPIDLAGGPLSGDIVSMKNYGHCDIVITIGVTTGTCAVTLDKSAAVAAATAELAFTSFLRSGFKLPISGANGHFTEPTGYTAGETITGGTSGATGVVVKDNGGHLLCHTWSGTAFTAGETITGGTSGYTATVSAVMRDEDILLPCRTASATTYTFTIPAVSAMTYVIPIEASDLGDGYDCLQLELADATNSCIGDAIYLFSQPRYAGCPMPTAIYD